MPKRMLGGGGSRHRCPNRDDRDDRVKLYSMMVLLSSRMKLDLGTTVSEYGLVLVIELESTAAAYSWT